MKKLIFLLLFTSVILVGQSQAQKEGFGLGVLLGEPTGVNFKVWTGYKTAVVGTAAWSFGTPEFISGKCRLYLSRFRSNPPG